MKRLILAGPDESILPVLERLRATGEHEVVGLGGAGKESLVNLYATIMELPRLEDLSREEWAQRADLLVSDGFGADLVPGLPRLGVAEARQRFLERSPVKDSRPADIDAENPQQLDAEAAQPVGAEPQGSATPTWDALSFPRELMRELQRSRRYHLGFCLTLMRIVDAEGRSLDRAAFRREPLKSLPDHVGRITDSWGLSLEGVLLHLAPEIQEQSQIMRKRLQGDLEELCQALPGGPWRVRCGQALFPKDGDGAVDLVKCALTKLENSLAVGRTGA